MLQYSCILDAVIFMHSLDALNNLNLRDWIEAHTEAKQQWLAEVRQNENTWAHWALNWTPEGRRKVGRPKKRWY